MEEIRELKNRLSAERPVDWDSLPDLSLYMDQVVGYMTRHLIGCSAEDRLTSAMVNNYIKDGHLPRAEGKRYAKAHLAYLTQLCALKTVLPVKDAGFLVNYGDETDVETRYEDFRTVLDAALKDTADRLPADCSREELPALALELALRSYADKLACQRIIATIREEQPESAKKDKKSKKDKKAE